MGVSAIAGAVVGGVMQGRAQKRASRENRRQQEAALAFQEEQIQLGTQELDKGFRFAQNSVLGMIERQAADMAANLEARGIDPAGTIGLGAKRRWHLTLTRNCKPIKHRAVKAALRQGQSFR